MSSGYSYLVLVSCICASWANPTRKILPALQWKCKKPIVGITVSPLVTKGSLRIMDIYWDVGELWMEGDYVGLYKQQPRADSPAVFLANVTGGRGWVRTGVQEGRRFQEVPNFNKTCFGFWSAYWRRGRGLPVAASCLGSNPRWMRENRKYIGNLKLTETFFPGTHDSGAFQVAHRPFEEDRYMKYIYAQDESIMEQLIHGARYLDFRVSKYKSGYWLNHGIARVRPLENSLISLREFMNKTEEIVVIDFHRFSVGFTKQQVHDEFIDYLRKELGQYTVPPIHGWSASLNQIWNSKSRLILAYNDQLSVRKHSDFLWVPVSQKWGDVRTLQDLTVYFSHIFSNNRRNGIMWSAMTELTADAWSIISDKMKGLRNMADSVNHEVSQWFINDWGRKCNAVAVDFIRSTSIVDSAIAWNKRKAVNSLCDDAHS
ncbi:PI-PLC X domain-containing protein 1-like [Cimex lectularius]|uniref:Uncharacterized protein n=1 Tax=Cimex lectularius TaxID=79782 RepID=A0A8I6S4U5_CIMLE|nr:PI-PLC X domain-containing protein 1-like [Cimex lectularius]